MEPTRKSRPMQVRNPDEWNSAWKQAFRESGMNCVCLSKQTGISVGNIRPYVTGRTALQMHNAVLMLRVLMPWISSDLYTKLCRMCIENALWRQGLSEGTCWMSDTSVRTEISRVRSIADSVRRVGDEEWEGAWSRAIEQSGLQLKEIAERAGMCSSTLGGLIRRECTRPFETTKRFLHVLYDYCDSSAFDPLCRIVVRDYLFRAGIRKIGRVSSPVCRKEVMNA